MKQLCHGGCRREARTEWARPGDNESWFLCAIHSLASRDLLHAQGFDDFTLDNKADETPRLTLTGSLDAPID